MENSVVKTVEERLESLRNNHLFMIDKSYDPDGIIRRKNSIYESGLMMHYTIMKFTKLKAKDGVKYRGKAVLQVHIEGKEPILFDCNVSSLLTYKIVNNRDKYINVVFSSYNTTPDYVSNPLRLVKSLDGSYTLYSVIQKGSVYETVVLPGGETVENERFIYFKKEEYSRYYEARQK